MRDLRIRRRQAGERRNVSDRLSLEVPAAAAAVPGARRAITRLCEHLGLAGDKELADSASVSTRPSRGTRVAMRFAIPHTA
jgi:hypothetical protein